MKLNQPAQAHRRDQRGFFLVIVMLVIVGVMLMYTSINLRTLATLKRNIRSVEQRQILRLQQSSPGSGTNVVSTRPAQL